jgi:predicted alpha-1,6-mannanase (GH76 family)
VPSPSPTCVAADAADAAFKAFTRAFYTETLGVGHFRAATEGTAPAAFWRSAELTELVEDAYQASGKKGQRRMIVALRRGVLSRYGVLWTDDRKFNDDVLWMALAFLRSYELTGDKASREAARRNFDAVVARGLSDDLGGGLWWTTEATQKNACVNGPGAVAACRLYLALGDRSYLERAESLYAWERERLFDESTGAVYDHVTRKADGTEVLNRQTYTYNQGTFIGAAQSLQLATGVPAYFVDALEAFAFARDKLTKDGILAVEGPDGSDRGGFKGIFARYAGPFAQGDVEGGAAWLAGNALAAWARRDGRGLVWQDWSEATPAGRLYAFDCSSAVVLMQVLRRR